MGEFKKVTPVILYGSRYTNKLFFKKLFPTLFCGFYFYKNKNRGQHRCTPYFFPAVF